MSKLRIIPLGGMGGVTKNMFVYEYDDEMLIVDCGIGFPEAAMPGVDLLIPDVSYLHEQLEAGKTIVGMFLTHGHDDHIAALGYILPDLPEFPIYASPLTAAFARQRMSDHKVERSVIEVRPRETIVLGQFSVESISMTHSVPDTRHLIIKCPEGTVYHGSDFKLDTNPVDGVLPDYDRITDLSQEGILCMMVDCLRIENDQMTPSESVATPALQQEMENVQGKIIVTLMSSHIHRIQQVVDIATQQGRKIVFIGRSVEQNVEEALQLNKLKLERSQILDKRKIEEYSDDKLCLIVAGSQGQEGSSLMRAIYGEHQILRISPEDKVIFSADAIPGNELNFYSAIDELSKNRIDVVYPEIVKNLHVSGHASAVEQRQLIEMAKPDYLFPIGGAYRHRKLFTDMCVDIGYKQAQILLPDDGQVVEFANGASNFGETLYLKELLVDGKGIGDVGTTVLSDRRALSQDGMVVIVVPKVGNRYDLGSVDVVSRGFIYMRDNEEFITEIKQMAAEVLSELVSQGEKEFEMKRRVEKKLTRKFDKLIGRTPLILTVFVTVNPNLGGREGNRRSRGNKSNRTRQGRQKRR